LVVLLPILFKVSIFIDNQIYDVEISQYFAYVVKYLRVNQLLESALVDCVFGVEQSIHLVDDVLGKVYYATDGVEELIEYF